VDSYRQPQGSPGATPTEDGARTTAQAASEEASLRAATSPPPAGVLEELSNALTSARATASNFLELVSLEAQRAGMSLVWMVAWAVVAGICLVATWLGLMAALAMWVTSLGLSPIAAVLLVALLNAAIGGALIFASIAMSRGLLFPATRRQLSGHRAVKASTP